MKYRQVKDLLEENIILRAQDLVVAEGPEGAYSSAYSRMMYATGLLAVHNLKSPVLEQMEDPYEEGR